MQIDPAEVARVAEGLTKAQRDRLLRIGEKLTAPKKMGLTTQALVPLMDLWRSERGIEPPIALVRRDYCDWPRLHWVYGLTPLGRAVRDLIEKGASR